MNATNNNTIAAISTPYGNGKGGIGIVRLSGKDSIPIVGRMFIASKKGKVSDYETHTVHHGHIRVPEKDEIIDEVLLTVMRAPRTYTAEDVAEINCHGGSMPLKRILELCIREGAVLAEPGEFTKRAFLNGRIDLSQAEAVLDVINAETDASCRIAVDHLRGVFSEEIRSLRDSIIGIISIIELSIDFSQEDVEFPHLKDITRRVRDVDNTLKKIFDTADKGIVMREGASVVICGRPNVGKSSLMNALLRHDRVIVTPVAGTTRDVIEESINIDGISVKLSDTAGIIETNDRIEKEGIKRSREKLKQADVVIFMLDSSCPLSMRDREIHETVKDKKNVIVANKSDLPRELDVSAVKKKFGTDEILKVSAVGKTGLDGIEDAIARKLFKGNIGSPEGSVVTNLRHKKAIEQAVRTMRRALKVTGDNYNGELLASDLGAVVRHLGSITGESVEDDILDRIFSEFCIGK